MAIRKIYTDPKTSNELEFYVNDEKKLFVQCGDFDNENDPYFNGWVCLDKTDVESIIKDLQSMLSKM